MAGASGPGLGALGALDPWVMGAGDAVAAGFRPQEKGLPAPWRRPGAPGAGGGPEAAPRRGGDGGAPLLPSSASSRASGSLGSQADRAGEGGARWARGAPGGTGGAGGAGARAGGDCGHSGRAGPDEPLQPAPPPILSPRAQNHPRLPDGGAPRSAKDAMVSRGFPENVRQKALRGVSRGSDGRFHVSIRINPQKQAYIGSSEDVCVAARMRDVAEVLLFGPAADTAFDVREYDLEAVMRLEWRSIGDFSSREAGIRDIAQMADHQGELARAERRAAREQGPLLPGMAAGDAFSMRDYVRECSRDFTLETHPFFFMEGVARQPPSEARSPLLKNSVATPPTPEAFEAPEASDGEAETGPLRPPPPPPLPSEPFYLAKGAGRPNDWGALGFALGVPPPPDPLRSSFVPMQDAFAAFGAPLRHHRSPSAGRPARQEVDPTPPTKAPRERGKGLDSTEPPTRGGPMEPLVWAETCQSFQCDACGDAFDNFRTFAWHCLNKGCRQAKKQWTCDLCDRVFSGPGNLAQHWTKGSVNPCAKEMRSRIPLRHAQPDTPAGRPDTPAGRPDTPAGPPMEPTEPLSLWAETCLSFQCDACGDTFDSFRSFGGHCQRKGCAQWMKRWTCDLCDREFSGPGPLSMHWTHGALNPCAKVMRSITCRTEEPNGARLNGPQTKREAKRARGDPSASAILEIKWL